MNQTIWSQNSQKSKTQKNKDKTEKTKKKDLLPCFFSFFAWISFSVYDWSILNLSSNQTSLKTQKRIKKKVKKKKILLSPIQTFNPTLTLSTHLISTPNRSHWIRREKSYRLIYIFPDWFIWFWGLKSGAKKFIIAIIRKRLNYYILSYHIHTL